ncbi:uncharacterized protein STEHIDRAFT_118431 [Stereum hirsutum FP-91666 SS1]|uniref:uncharacterized protein n=1 Tax=Stereum hirsutum (strain FP-91666) TaxID=721885 RepID=UPI000440D924|nr:uncharacterized protein STEHIDRAFT_118431 [Stereum hirsutum FP-91666 SS1]EIM91346.1 hypothetical protein STEHIDRAFT_118431 [Stereum hirsutum FP-91666 SS1]
MCTFVLDKRPLSLACRALHSIASCDVFRTMFLRVDPRNSSLEELKCFRRIATGRTSFSAHTTTLVVESDRRASRSRRFIERCEKMTIGLQFLPLVTGAIRMLKSLNSVR